MALSVLDLATVREGGTVAESFRNTVQLAQAAEAWGYHCFWLAEHHNMPGIASAATSVLDCYQLADRLHSYEIVARLFLKPIKEQN